MTISQVLSPLDPIALASKVAQLVKTGRRESTYKLATLMALIDISLESSTLEDGVLSIPVEEIVHRIVAYYWPQTRPYHAHGLLRQNKAGLSMADKIAVAKAELSDQGVASPEAAREASHPIYVRLVKSLSLTVAQQPLTHLQTVSAGGASVSDDFLFDASLFRKKMTLTELRLADPIRLRPGVAAGLRTTAILLKDVLRSRWVAEVIRFNRATLDDADLDGFLFDHPRPSLRPLHQPLLDLQHGFCMYCRTRIHDVEIDHVLPWSLVPINGVANLVASCSRCNGNKSNTIPVRPFVDAALARNGLDDVSRTANFPLLLDRTRSAAAGLYGSIPPKTVLWSGYQQYVLHTRPSS
jgi:5-methylcytosine-specific restriction endonuclease McrA